MVLQWLKEHQLYANPAKCSFFVNTIEYLGFIIGLDGIKLNPDLVKVLQNFPQSQTLRQLQSFLGLANYYQIFIENFSRIACPLTEALQNASTSRPIIWNHQMIIAFNNLKNALTSAPCLQLSDPHGKFEVTTDASEDEATTGVVLTQNEHPIAYDFQKFNQNQRNYPYMIKKYMQLCMH